MRTGTTKWIPSGGALLLTVALIAGCGDDGDGGDSSANGADAGVELPTTYTGPFLQIEKVEGGRPVEVGGRLSAEDGSVARVNVVLPDAGPGESTSAECGGETVEASAVIDAPGGSGTAEIGELGTIALTLERTVTVIDEPGAAPLCDEHTGTWVGTEGELDGHNGTFSIVSRQPETAPDATELTVAEE